MYVAFCYTSSQFNVIEIFIYIFKNAKWKLKLARFYHHPIENENEIEHHKLDSILLELRLNGGRADS